MRNLIIIWTWGLLMLLLPSAVGNIAYGAGRDGRDTVVLEASATAVLNTGVDGNRSGAMFSGGEADGFSTSCLLPRIIAQGPTEFTCVGDSIVFELVAEGTGLVYRWQKFQNNGFEDMVPDGDRLKGLNTDRLVMRSLSKLRDDGIYRCLVKNDCGEVYTDSIRVNIDAIPTIVAGMNKNMTYICATSREITLTTTAESPNKNLQYRWSRVDTVSGSEYTFPPDANNFPYLKITPTDRSYEGMYVVTVGNQCGEVKDSAYLPVFMPAAVDYVNFDENHEIEACRGENVKIRTVLSGGGTYTYVLKKVKKKTLVPLAYEVEYMVDTAKSEVIIENVGTADEGYYVWEVSNECGRDTSELIYLRVSEPPVFKQEMPDTLFCEGAKLEINCLAEGHNVEYYWRHNGELLNENSGKVVIEALAEKDAGIYVCYAHNICERHVASRSIRVEMDPRPTFLRDPYLMRPACVGDSVVDFGVLLSNVRADSIRWHLDFDPLREDQVFRGTTTEQLSVYNITDEQRGVYFVKAYNHCGVTTSKAVELKHLGRAPSIKNAFGGKTMLLCAGRDHQLRVEVEGDAPLHYRWRCGREVLAESDTNFTEITAGQVNDTALYCVHVQNVCGSDEECARLNIARIESYPLTGGGGYCDGQASDGEIILPKSDTAILYSVYREPGDFVAEFKGSADTIRLKDQPAGSYYVLGRDTNNCVQRMENNIEVDLYHSPAPSRFIISRHGCVNNSGAELMQMEWEKDVEYKLYRLADSGEWEWYKGQRFIGGYTSIGSPAAGDVKMWTGIEPGRYKLIARDLDNPNKCEREIFLDDSVQIYPAPGIYNLRAENNRWVNCSGETEQIVLYADGFEKNCKYTLEKNGTGFGQVLKSTPIQWGHIEAGKYRLIVENQWGCTSESPAVQVTDGISPGQITLAGNGAICEGDTDPYKELVIVNSEPGVTYKIYREHPDTYMGEVTGTGGATPAYKLPAQKASYYITATDRTGKCISRMAEKFIVGVSDFTVRTMPSEIFLDKGVRTRLHASVEGDYSEPIEITWDPHNKIEWGVVMNPNTQVHKQYYWPYYPFPCPTNLSDHRHSHGPWCTVADCPFLYAEWDPAEHGCVYQGTEYTTEAGRRRPWYDVYYCRNQISEPGVGDSEAELEPNPFKDPLTVPVYEDTRYTVTMTDAVGCSYSDIVDVKVTGKRLHTEITALGIHKHYAEPFCPCGCGRYRGHISRNHHTHGTDCKDPTCWLYYHRHKHKGYTKQGTAHKWFEGEYLVWYDLYYFNSAQEAADTVVYKNEKLMFYSSTTGGDYKYTYDWSFVAGDGSVSAYDFKGDSVFFHAHKSGYLFLDVYSMGQHSRDSIWIEVESKPLLAEIRDENCGFRLDTMRICQGEGITLCGWAVGGDTDHRYRWQDNEGDRGSANHLSYQPESSGNIYFIASSGDDIRVDSVYIQIMQSPQKLAIDDPGVRCPVLGQKVQIRVPRTEKGLNYVLEYGGKNADFKDYGQRFNEVDGKAVTFEIADPLLEDGLYRVRVDRVNAEKTCSTYLSDVEILKPITPVVIEDTAYCRSDNGLKISLKSVEADVRYMLCLPDGRTLDTLEAPALSFKRPLLQGNYIFRSERVGRSGTCPSEVPLQVVTTPDPDITLAVEVNSNGRVCAGEEIMATVKGTEQDVVYELVDPRNRTLASFTGDGTDLTFENLNKQEEGKYMIRATRDGCSVYLDNAVKVNPLPRQIAVLDTGYCYPYQEIKNNRSVDIDLENLQGDVLYRLYSGKDLIATVEGPGVKPVAGLVDGQYRLEGENRLTGCLSVVGEFRVTAKRGPAVFNIGNDCSAWAEVNLQGSEDSVKYSLYRDEELMKKLQGTGDALEFGLQTLSGIYRVLGTNVNSKCEAWMDGSIAIYQLDTCSLRVNGVVCEGSNPRYGVDVYYPCSRKGWTYYLKKLGPTVLSSNELEGTGGELWWSNFGRRPIRDGEYELWARRDCDTVLVKTLTIEARPMIKGYLQPLSATLCRNEFIELSVTSATPGIKYTLSTPVEGFNKTLSEKVAAEATLSLGKFRNHDIYSLSAAYEDGGCATPIGGLGELHVVTEATPERLTIGGEDICEGSARTIQLCLPEGKKESNVYYYLENNATPGISVDSMTATYHANHYCFDPRSEVGCYTVLGYHTASGCRDTMNGVYCLGAQPWRRHVRVDTNRYGVTEVGLCAGQSAWIMMDSTDLGVKYLLMKDGLPYGQDTIIGKGDARSKRIGLAKETGLYTVKAFNGCEATMLDTIKVKIGDPTEMRIRDTYYLCSAEPGEPGAVIEIYNAEKNCKFELYQGKTGGDVLDTQTAAHTGDTVRFTGTYREEGFYRITAASVWGCYEEKVVEVKLDTMPDMQQVISSSGNFICEQGCTEISLSGVQPNVEYRLVNAGTGLEEGFFLGGFGESSFDKICAPGEYYVEATRFYYPRCSREMDGRVVLAAVDTIKSFRLLVEDSVYCAGDPGKATITLSGSEAGVVYELYCDGQPTGLTRQPNRDGTAVTWRGVKGKLVSGISTVHAGYEYTVLARKIDPACEKFMPNTVRVIEEEQLEILAFDPENNQELCEGKPIHFNVVASGYDLKYLWYRDATLLTPTSSTLVIDSLTTDDFGVYSCEVENTCGKKIAGRVEIRVMPKVTLDEKIGDKTLCEGKAAYLFSRMSNVQAGNYKWYKEDKPAEILSTDSYLVLNPVKASDAGKYICEGTSVCSTVSDRFLVNVDPNLDSMKLTKLIDTVCIGAEWRLRVDPVGNAMRWLKDGEETGTEGHIYSLPKVKAEDAGLYSVVYGNTCGEKTTPVGQLLVDDTVKVLAFNEAQMICGGAPLDLFIKTVPWNRVEYRWFEGTEPIGTGDKLTVTPDGELGQRTYRVRYSNKCTDEYKSVSMTLSRNIRMEHPPKSVLLCAGEVTDSTICVHVEGVDVLDYKWLFNKSGQARKADTLSRTACQKLDVSSNATGYYYCTMETECGRLNSETSWVVIDSCPTLSPLSPVDSVCEGGYLEFEVDGTGGTLVYTWELQMQGETTWRRLDRGEGLDFVSRSHYLLGPASSEYDGATIRCIAENRCGADTVASLLYVDRARSLHISPEDVRVCEGAEAKITVELKNGVAPWSYKYSYEDESEVARFPESTVDMLEVTRPGTYRILYLRDGSRCMYHDTLATFTVKTQPLSTAVLSVVGKDTLCRGDQAEIRIEVQNGFGPWEVSILRSDGTEALETGKPMPFYVYDDQRNMTITFPVNESETYYLGGIKDMAQSTGTTCLGNVLDSARFVVLPWDTLRFNFSQDTFGYCKPVKLDTLLKPNMAGDFYIDGARTQNNTFNPASPRMALGEHTIEYRTKGRCPAGNNKVKLWIEDKPNLVVTPRDTALCPGESVEIVLHPEGKGPFELNYNISTIRAGGSILAPEKNPLTGLTGDKKVNVYNPGDGKDSVRRVVPISLIDKYGCWADHLDVLVANVDLRRYPEFEVYGRHKNYNDNEWAEWIDPYIIPEKDTVEFKVELISGAIPWAFNLLYSGTESASLDVTDIYTRDTVYKASASGEYKFRVVDGDQCSKPNSAETRHIYYKESGYLRAKVLLEGPYDVSTGKMNTFLYDNSLLPAYAGVDWSVFGATKIVDWLVVEARENPDSEPVSQDTVLIREDGVLLNPLTGRDTLTLKNTSKLWGNDRYYIVLRHRNHVAVMSKDKLLVADADHKADAVFIDFTQESSVYSTGASLEMHMTKLDATHWAMAAGYDLTPDDLVSIANPNATKRATERETQAQYKDYYKLDVNFDGIVQWPQDVTPGDNIFDAAKVNLYKSKDAWIVQKNRNKYSAVPQIRK